MNRVLKSNLKLSGGGEQDMRTTYLASWVMVSRRRLEKMRKNQQFFQNEGNNMCTDLEDRESLTCLATLKDTKMTRA